MGIPGFWRVEPNERGNRSSEKADASAPMAPKGNAGLSMEESVDRMHARAEAQEKMEETPRKKLEDIMETTIDILEKLEDIMKKTSQDMSSSSTCRGDDTAVAVNPMAQETPLAKQELTPLPPTTAAKTAKPRKKARTSSPSPATPPDTQVDDESESPPATQGCDDSQAPPDSATLAPPATQGDSAGSSI